jgi:hypothetical protein
MRRPTERSPYLLPLGDARGWGRERDWEVDWGGVVEEEWRGQPKSCAACWLGRERDLGDEPGP